MHQQGLAIITLQLTYTTKSFIPSWSGGILQFRIETHFEKQDYKCVLKISKLK